MSQGDLSCEPVLSLVPNINAYLLPRNNVLVTSRRKPLQAHTPIMDNGSKPVDGGFLSSIDAETAATIRGADPIAAAYLRPIIGARELIHGEERWCLWLTEAPLSDIQSSPVLRERVAAVRAFRLASDKEQTVRDAARPTLFQQIRQPRSTYLAIPLLSSHLRDYLPVARYGPDTIVNNLASFVDDGSLSTFGILSSSVFTVWSRAVSGRFKSDIRVSNKITYNNFPFPDLSLDQRDAVETSAEHILTARESFPHNTLADLYDPALMPEPLRRAHQNNDRVVLGVFGLPADASDDDILAVLFARYEELSAAA
jgi:hypothetical protein